MHLFRIEGRRATKAVTPIALLILSSTLSGQAPSDAGPSRWSVEAVALGGPGVLVGVAASFDVLRAAPVRLALETSVLVNVWQDNEYAPCPMPPATCTAPRKPPFIADASTLALRGEYPLGASWRLVASAGVLAGDWVRPNAAKSLVPDLEVGLARQSSTGRHALVVRGHRIHTHSYPTYAARVSWRLRL